MRAGHVIMRAMKRLCLLAVLGVVIALPARADFAAGKSAYDQDDFAAAFAELMPLAEAGDARAQAVVGHMYYFGRGVTRNLATAAKWTRKAAVQGDAQAQNDFGTLLRTGKGVSKDLAESFRWFLRAAEQGYADAQYNVGISLEHGRGVPRDEPASVNWYRRAAEQGDADAQVNLGAAYEFGKGGLKIDHRKAVELYRKSAEQGHPIGQFNLGNAYYQGQGVRKSFARAIQWFDKAAKQGYNRALHALGVMMEFGDGIPKVPSEAFRYYTNAAEAGHASSQYNLGVAYELGSRVVERKRDFAKAIAWFRKAAAQSHPRATFRLAGLVARGAGVPRDLTRAHGLASRAAQSGHAKSRDLADVLADGTLSDQARLRKICQLTYSAIQPLAIRVCVTGN